MPRYRIVAIAQIHNEIRRGNLERFFTYLKPLVDDIVIYDDASTDGSYEYAAKHATRVLRGVTSSFKHETLIKKELLSAAQEMQPDFVLWLDADEVLSAGGTELVQKLCHECISQNADAISLHELNLWRSTDWIRLDERYNDGWYVRLWRNTSQLQYLKTPEGLHKVHYPQSIKVIHKSETAQVLHYGFSTDDSIMFKYLNYRRHGQRGWALNRFIDESKLQLEKVPTSLFPDGLVIEQPKPQPRSLRDWNLLLEQRSDDLLKPGISIISMIYKSTAWLKFCYEQVLKYTDMRDKEFFFVANDPTDEVLSYLERHYIPHKVFRTTPEQKQEWYINNVYRGYNFGAEQARGDYLLFINSDMAFTPNWVEQLLENVDGRNCIASRLVESGKLASGAHAISKNFGREIENYDEASFQKYAATIRRPGAIDGGLYMPLLIKKQDLLDVGGYPEGNVAPDSDPFHPVIVKKGEPLISGDTSMIQKITARGIKHQTSNASIVYHFQEGEKDDAPTTNKDEEVEIIIANDYLTGRNGERTMWDFLLEKLPGVAGVDLRVLGPGEGFERRAKWYIKKKYPNAKIIVQNATFIDLIDPTLFTVGILQDDLRKMGTPSPQQESNLKRANVLVTNSLLTAASYPEYTFERISLGVDDALFSPQDKRAVRAELGLHHDKIGIFVGSLSETKGWSEVKAIITARPDIHWLVVSKYDETYEAPNVSMFRQIDQAKLSKLLNASDFFLLGSPVETQCLAAVEACLCDVPVIMHNTGIFADFTEAERAAIGYFSEKLDDKIDLVYQRQHTFTPREVITKRDLTIDAMCRRWQDLLLDVAQDVHQRAYIDGATPWSKRVKASLYRKAYEFSMWAFRVGKVVVKFILPRRVADRFAKSFYARRPDLYRE